MHPQTFDEGNKVESDRVWTSSNTGLGNETGKFQNFKKSAHEFFYLFIGYK